MKTYISLFLFIVFNVHVRAQSCLIGDYSFSGNANDGSIYQNNGNVTGATLTADRFSNPNAALFFDGINDFVDLGNPQELNFSTNSMFTFSLWTKTCTITEQRIFSKRSYYAGIEIMTIDNALWAYVGDINNNYAWQITTSNPVTDCNWHHFVVIFDGVLNQITVYQNNQNTNLPINTSNVSGLTTNTSNAFIGSRESGGFFNGIIDDFKIYNCKLSDEDINELYFQGIGLHDNAEEIPFQMYPNPASEYVVINYDKNVEAILTVYNIQGQAVYSRQISESIQLNTAHWSAGMYFVEIKNNQFLAVDKLIIK